jgi:general stress protein 26
MTTGPTTELDQRYSEPDTKALDWSTATAALEAAELFWISTVRPDGRLHVTPLVAVWLDDAAYIATGSDEAKAKNLAENPHFALTTGCNKLHEGLDLVLEGEAELVRDRDTLERVADANNLKYDGTFSFSVGDGVLTHEEGEALVYKLAPDTAYGFGKAPYNHTRWTF